jgi:hypothetical protein
LLLPGLAVLLTVTGCLGYVRRRIDEPLPAQRLEALQPGSTDLATALAALGAPNEVFEYQGSGAVLIYAWEDTDDWSLDLSVPLARGANARFELDLTATDRPGAVLWFGADLRLLRWQSGRLGELPGRLRPAASEDVDAGPF